MTTPDTIAAPRAGDAEIEAAARAFCRAKGADPDFFYDGRREWQKVGFIDFDLRSAFEEAETELTTLRASLAEAEARIAGMREALEPFAERVPAAAYDMPPETIVCRAGMEIKHFRRARQALASLETKETRHDG